MVLILNNKKIKGDIKFENVGFSYDTNNEVLSDVSFIAKQGEVTAIIGPSGGGKTTVSRLASRFWDITKGKITVGGNPRMKNIFRGVVISFDSDLCRYTYPHSRFYPRVFHNYGKYQNW